jgi:hypothetical protein
MSIMVSDENWNRVLGKMQPRTEFSIEKSRFNEGSFELRVTRIHDAHYQTCNIEKLTIAEIEDLVRVASDWLKGKD